MRLLVPALVSALSVLFGIPSSDESADERGPAYWATLEAEVGPSAQPGAGVREATCIPGSIHIESGDDIVTIVNTAPEGVAFCIHGLHRITQPLLPKSNQLWVGEDDAVISGAARLQGWVEAEPGVWAYSGRLATRENIRDVYTNSGATACYEVSIYQDDLFYNDQRMLRVLSLDQLKGLADLPDGQAETEVEFGRFYHDHDNDVIYVDQSPFAAVVDMSVQEFIINVAEEPRETINSVRFANITFEKARTAIIDGQEQLGWRFEDVTIRFAHNVGIHTGYGTQTSPYIFRRVLVTNNGQGGILAGGQWVEVVDSEISWNNIVNYRNTNDLGECNSRDGTAGLRAFSNHNGTPANPGLKIMNSLWHHNVADAIHVDVHSENVLVRGNHFYDNERAGYTHEISCYAEITRNVFERNGLIIKNDDTKGAGVFVYVANDAWVHDNIFRHMTVYGGAFLVHEPHLNMLDGCIEAEDDDDVSNALMNNTVEDNLFEICTAYVGGKVGEGESLAGRNNFFLRNSYTLPDRTAGWWRDLGDVAYLTFAEWQAAGQDLEGKTFNGADCA